MATGISLVFAGTESARAIYSQACAAAGENPEFTASVAELVGSTADSFEDLADRFKAEGEVMLAAAALARKAARPHTLIGHCDACGADKVAVRPIGHGLHKCVSCDVLG